MRAQDIVNWVAQTNESDTVDDLAVPDDAKDQVTKPQQLQQQLSPPQSTGKRKTKADESYQTPRKRPRPAADPEVGGVEDTPRPSLQPASESRSQRQSQSQSARSTTSGRSSPSKHIAALELDPVGLERRNLSLKTPGLPATLVQLLLDLDMCNNGGGVLPRSMEVQIKELAKTDPELQTVPPWAYVPDEERRALGPTPSVDQVTKIVVNADEAHTAEQNEAAWNMMVHWPVLESAVFGLGRQKQLVGVAPCTTAKIIREHLPMAFHPKMIDFAIYMQPEHDTSAPSAANAVEALRRELPLNVINHTDYFSLRHRPLAVSVESKRRNAHLPGTAELQTGTWHAAHWRLLEDLAQRCGGSLEGLPFLPAIIVNGNEWSLAVTTREKGKTILWLEKQFGSTSSTQGTYKVIWGVQRLLQWSRDVYWPWYRANALGIGQH